MALLIDNCFSIAVDDNLFNMESKKKRKEKRGCWWEWAVIFIYVSVLIIIAIKTSKVTKFPKIKLCNQWKSEMTSIDKSITIQFTQKNQNNKNR